MWLGSISRFFKQGSELIFSGISLEQNLSGHVVIDGLREPIEVKNKLLLHS